MATATATMPRVGADIKFEYGQPEIFALRFTSGKNVQGRFGPRVLFTCTDERKIWLDAEDGSDFERKLRELQVQEGQFVQVTKIRHPRGGGHSFEMEAEAPRAGAHSWQGNAPAPVSPTQKITPVNGQPHVNTPTTVASAPHAQAGPLSPAVLRFMGAYKDAVDILLQTQGYAKSEGLLLDIRCEDVRCLAATIMIDAKGGR